jgi:hypothetical protein
VLEIVFGHHSIAGALRIPCKGGVLLGDLLRGTADLHIRPVALVAAGQRVRALAVLVVIVVAVIIVSAAAAAPAHAPVLLWPHSGLSFEDAMESAQAEFACLASCVGGQPLETGNYRHVLPVPFMYFPDDPRTKLKRCRLRKKAVCSHCSQGTESITALPASSHPVSGNYLQCRLLPSGFLQYPSGLCEGKRQ